MLFLQQVAAPTRLRTAQAARNRRHEPSGAKKRRLDAHPTWETTTGSEVGSRSSCTHLKTAQLEFLEGHSHSGYFCQSSARGPTNNGR